MDGDAEAREEIEQPQESEASGAKPKMSRNTKITLAGVAVIAAVIAYYSPPPPPLPPEVAASTAVAPTPEPTLVEQDVPPVQDEPIAAETTPAPIDKEGDNNKIENATLYVALLTKRLHDPSSLQLQDVRLADDGTFCTQFRAKNAFNALVLDTIIERRDREYRGEDASDHYDQ